MSYTEADEVNVRIQAILTPHNKSEVGGAIYKPN